MQNLELIKSLIKTCESALEDLETIEAECEGVTRAGVTGIIPELRSKISFAKKALVPIDQEKQPNLPLDPLPVV